MLSGFEIQNIRDFIRRLKQELLPKPFRICVEFLFVLVVELQSILEGEIHKKAYKLIWLRFFWFSTDFFEIFSQCWI